MGRCQMWFHSTGIYLNGTEVAHIEVSYSGTTLIVYHSTFILNIENAPLGESTSVALPNFLTYILSVSFSKQLSAWRILTFYL